MTLAKIKKNVNLMTEQIFFNNDERLLLIKGSEYRCTNCRRDFDKKNIQEFLNNINSKKGHMRKRPVCPNCNSYLKSKIYTLNKKDE